MAKVIGEIAEDAPLPNKELGGILVKRNFSYQIMSPEDVAKHTDLVVSNIIQRQAIRFSSSIEALQYHLLQLTEDVKIVENKESLQMGLLVFGKVKLTRVEISKTGSKKDKDNNCLIIEWQAGPVADMLADACMAITLRVDALSGKKGQSHMSAKDYSEKTEPKILKAQQWNKFVNRLHNLLENQYGHVMNDSPTRWSIEIGDKCYAKINLDTLTVECEEDEQVAQLIEESVKRLHIAVMPITKVSVLQQPCVDKPDKRKHSSEMEV